MNASVTTSIDRDGDSVKATARSASYRGPSSRRDRAGEAYSDWLLEDIDAPEVWSLASFDDLVPRESV